ncbi:MAG: response regulator transcription factor [Erythrobacter sp.]|uniref:response regulator transcription factor n=1 Tax=Erythrobacter sp. HL-111 TaxID=1798193 RepID=UPI0006DB4D90|nr:response regulator transcription factor [Erythrobacter sp. HL-111]KPP90138.1 MAG: Response regulators consisting of a CheY-like receiver domain and a winged-helix DNA-binding domain [Erythrobacteraceae bacterium HL-111]SDR81505.1 Response regulator receiver domain-containing protein [Erythrobacter sp. HL-111]
MAHILIADDDDLIAEIVGEALAAAGHPSRHVPSAEAAWESVHASRPDLLLLDRDMPGMPGLALLARLRASALLFDLPVVILTAMRGAGDEGEALRAGAQDFIRKPFDPAALVRRIEAVLEAGVKPWATACGEDRCGASSDRQRHLSEPRRA